MLLHSRSLVLIANDVCPDAASSAELILKAHFGLTIMQTFQQLQ